MVFKANGLNNLKLAVKLYFLWKRRKVIHSMNTHAHTTANDVCPTHQHRGVRGHELKHSDVLMHHLFKLKTRKGKNCISGRFLVSRSPLRNVLLWNLAKKGLLWLHAQYNLTFNEMLNYICNHNWHKRLKGCGRRWKLVDVAHFLRGNTKRMGCCNW